MDLKQEKEKVFDQRNMLKYEAMRGNPASYNKASDRYDRASQKLEDIERDYAINIQDLANIISQYTGVKYVAKIFRELGEDNGVTHYTHRYIACFVNEDNPYYQCTEGVIIPTSKYKEMLRDLGKTKSFVFSRSEELCFVPLNPEPYLERVNFIQCITRGYCDSMINDRFMKRVAPMIKADLENTNVINNDENFNIGL